MQPRIPRSKPDNSRTQRPPWGPRALYWRNRIQIAALVLMNSYFFVWAKGFCVPALNCWACPGAIFACPLGALQHDAIRARSLMGTTPWYAIAPLYTAGLMLIFMAFFGRMMCGWICPFGWLQDKLAKLRRRHWKLPCALGYLRYAMLIGLIFVIPYLTGVTWFCKLCPQGALEGGLLQPIFTPFTRAGIGNWWWIKQAILLAVLVAAVLIRRPFCNIFCPLGALFSLMQRYSLWRIDYDDGSCVNCMWCVRNCPAGIDPRSQVNSHACIGCLECCKCPYDAINSTPMWRPQPTAPATVED